MRTVSKLLVAAAIAAAALLAPGLAEAQAAGSATATANMTVSASVARRCQVTGPAAAVNFADYDPMSATQLSAVGSIRVRCVRGTGYTIALTSSSNFQMTGPGGAAIPYTILQPNGTTAWSATPLDVAGNTVNSSGWLTYDATVRPTIGQDVPEGAYTDTVNITVTY